MSDSSTSTVLDSFGADDKPASDASPTNESIKNRHARRRLVNAGELPADQMPRQPRILTPIVSVDDAAEHLRAAALSALTMPSSADED